MTTSTRAGLAAILLTLTVGTANAAGQSAEDIARALQDPLANIKALMSDNTVNFNSGDPETTGYNFQLQPVYAIPMESVNLILRAVVPIVGAPPNADFPNLGQPQPPGDSTEWGLSDIIFQTFINPKGGGGSWKWGVGPQVSMKTQASAAVAGPGWGAGAGVVVVGGFGDAISVALLASQHWGFDGNFSTATIQPSVFYNLPNAWTIHYNNAITANWKAEGSNAWTIPLGAGVSKSVALPGGHGVDVSVGYYGMATTPDGGPNSQMKFGITWLIP